MTKATKISILFFLIFLLGILGVVTYVNKTLNKHSFIEISTPQTLVAFKIDTNN